MMGSLTRETENEGLPWLWGVESWELREGLNLHVPWAAAPAGDFYAGRMQAGKGEGG